MDMKEKNGIIKIEAMIKDRKLIVEISDTGKGIENIDIV